jgi:hypothetical protein
VPLGRPRTYCSPECRRGVERMRRELPFLEAARIEAEQMATNGHWRGPHYWRSEARRLKMAIDEARWRIHARAER